TPNENYNGGDTFTFNANDGQADSSVATVSITVNAVNDDPVAVDDLAITGQDTPVDVDVLANDTDVEGDNLSVASVTDPANGSVVNNGSNVTYTPNAGFTGDDTFTYTADDGNGGTATANVTVSVEPAGSEPIAHWKLDETEGTAAHDSSGNGHDGTLSYSGWAWTPDGRIDGALAFVNGFGRVTLDAPVDVAESHTITAWITAPIKDGKWLYLVADAAGNGFLYAYAGELGIRSIELNRFVGCGFDMRSLAAGWHHVAAVADGGVTGFYV
ncbi:unnamed protein product, partial [marine sediment metagenome]